MEQEESCERCGKPRAVCVCDRIEPLASRVRVLVLQHPQEDDVVLGTARLVSLTLPEHARIARGLSWASLEHAIETAGWSPEGIDRERWAVLAAAKLPEGLSEDVRARPVLVLDRKGRVRERDAAPIEGLVVLDGTWSQAKTLWWRNPWLLKLSRVVLRPREPSMYGKLRREPRREWVSTLEAIADALPALGEPEATRDALRRALRTMLQRARDAQAAEERTR